MSDDKHDLGSIAGRLKYLRWALRYPSERSFSKKLFGNPTFMQGFFAGDREPDIDSLRTIFRGTNVTLDWLVDGVGEPDLGPAIFYDGASIETMTDRKGAAKKRESQRPSAARLRSDAKPRTR